jgi:colicin import membrane protein
MWVWGVARGVMVAITALVSASAHANEAAHEMAEKFAGEAKGAVEPAEATKRDAERKAPTARVEAARKRAEAARRTADAKRRAADEAARAAERRREEETDMLARARREADEMRADAEEARLTEEARRLILEAERERAKAEALLAGQPDAPRPAPIATGPQLAGSGEAERRSLERTEETRRLVEKLKRVRQIHATRIADRARREADIGSAVLGRPPQPSAAPSLGAVGAPGAVALPVPPATPLQGRPPPRAPQEAAMPAAANAPGAAAAQVRAPSDVPPTTRTAVTTAQSGPPPIPAGGATAAPPLDKPDETASGVRAPSLIAPGPPASPAAAQIRPGQTTPSVGVDLDRVTVLLVMAPGSYGIRRGGAQVADPILCMRDGCYISAGADRPATFLPGRRALGLRNTWGARAGACRNALGCVFRGVELGTLPTFLQPVDLHIFKHDVRPGFAVLADSDCAITAGRLTCRHGIDAQTYALWVVPERLAQILGPAGLERALSEGLNGPRSALLAPRQLAR